MKRIILISSLLFIIMALFTVGCKPDDPPSIEITQGSTGIFLNTTYIFESESVGESSDDITFTLKNTGGSDLSVSEITLTGNNANQFNLSASTPIVIKANEDSSFSINFSPSSGGLKTATISIFSNSDINEEFTFKVTGSGTTGEILLTREGVPLSNGGVCEFGNLLTNDGTKDITLTISNIGDEDLDLISFGNSNQSGAFTLSNLPDDNAIIESGDEVDFTVTFDPLINGQSSTTITIMNSDPENGTFVFTAKGYGTASEIYVIQNVNIIEHDDGTNDDIDYNFGGVIQGESKQITFGIGNVGDGVLTVSDVSLSGDDASLFTLDTTDIDTDGVIPPSSEKEFTVTFAPTSLGDKSARISITSDDELINPYEFNLLGKGVYSDIAIENDSTTVSSGDNYEYWDTELTFASDPAIFTVSNTGTGDLRITDINLSGTNPGEFTIDNLPSFPYYIEPNDTFDLSVSFTPTLEQVSDAVLTIESNSTTNSTFTVDLSGRGDDTPPPTVTDLTSYKGTGIRLTWTAPDQSALPTIDQDAYVIELTLTNTSGSYQKVHQVDPSVTEYEFEYVPVADEYDVLVKVYDRAGISSGENPDESVTDLPDEMVNDIQFHIHTRLNKWGDGSDVDGTVRQPYGIAVDSANNVYIVDTTYHYIQKFDSAGNFIMKWGEYGTEDGEFDNPRGVTVVDEGGSDYVYVVDSYNFRIQKFDTSGNFILSWGSVGQNDGEFLNPHGILSVEEGGTDYIYVTDTDNHRIQKFSTSGAYQSEFGSYGTDGTGDGEFNQPKGITVDSGGNLYVADSSNHRIQKFDSAGNYLSQWGSNGTLDGEFNSPSGIAVVNETGTDYVYVSDSGNGRIQKFDTSGTHIGTYAGFNEVSFISQFNDGSDTLLFSNMVFDVVDGKAIYNVNSSIKQFDVSSETTSDYITNTPNPGLLNDPLRMSVDSSGNLFVADTGNNRIVKYSFDGSNYSYDTEVAVTTPVGVAIDGSDDVYVVDNNGGDKKIRKFNNNLSLINDNLVPTGYFSKAVGLEINKTTGKIYVGDEGNKEVFRFASNGTYELSWGSYGIGNGEFMTIRDIAVSPVNGDVYVASTGSVWIPNSMVIQRFDADGNFIIKWANQYFLDQVKTITVDKDGNLCAAVVNAVQKIILKYEPDSDSITTVYMNGFKQHHWKDTMCVTADAQGNMYYLDTKWDSIIKLSE